MVLMICFFDKHFSKRSNYFLMIPMIYVYCNGLICCYLSCYKVIMYSVTHLTITAEGLSHVSTAVDGEGK